MRRWLTLMALVLAAGAASAQTGKLTVRNLSGAPIMQLQVSPIDAESWTADLLEGAALGNGQMRVFPLLENDLYDLRIVDAAGRACVIADVDFFQFSLHTISRDQLIACPGWGKP